jgi:glycosyltransferase involved in cell wall biosynthesis
VIAVFKSDIILYLSPSGSGFMTPLKYLQLKKVIINHGGLNEWEREKLNTVQKMWAKFNHFFAAKFADVNVVDNLLYQESLKFNFNVSSTVIRYGGDHVHKIFRGDLRYIEKYPFVADEYAISVSRAQIDNNIHMVLEAFESFKKYKVVLISNWSVSSYGESLKNKYQHHPNMILLDAIYDKEEIDFLRSNAYVYIHSHSRCGTAPSLVEAMCLQNAVISYDVPTNRETTENSAYYFSDVPGLLEILSSISHADAKMNGRLMIDIGKDQYSWDKIASQYRDLINSLF